MGINQRVSLRKFIDDIKRWVNEGRSDEWVASALGASSSSVQSFRSCNSIYHKDPGAALAEPAEHGAYEGAIEASKGSRKKPGSVVRPVVADDPSWQAHWSCIDRVEVRLGPTKVVLVDRSG